MAFPQDKLQACPQGHLQDQGEICFYCRKPVSTFVKLQGAFTRPILWCVLQLRVAKSQLYTRLFGFLCQALEQGIQGLDGSYVGIVRYALMG